MKVLTQDVCIGDEHFFLIEDDDKVVGHYYGTINYKDTQCDCGITHLARTLNGNDMCIDKSIGGAINARRNDIMNKQFLAESHIDHTNITDPANIKKFLAFMNEHNYPVKGIL